jgi:hypothetical protein
MPRRTPTRLGRQRRGAPDPIDALDYQQNLGTFFVGFVEHGKKSKLQLSEGYYSLSTLSTVPYVSLIGMGKREKVFSWNEIVEVPPGKIATVKNVSHHDGDIVINGGRDYGAAPRRITVPVPVFDAAGANDPPVPGDAIEVRYPADVRRARAAWFVVDWQTGDTEVLIRKLGERRLGSHNTAAGPVEPAGYFSEETIPPNTVFSAIPLGYTSAVGQTEAQCLLDTAEIRIETAADTVFYTNTVAAFDLFNAYYVIEY